MLRGAIMSLWAWVLMEGWQWSYETTTWLWACEQEWIFLGYFDDMDKIFLEYPYAT